MDNDRGAAMCPGPKGEGCDCKAHGADPACPWQSTAVAKNRAPSRELMVEREVASWGLATGRGAVIYLNSDDYVVLSPKLVHELHLACHVFQERVDGNE